MSSHRAGLRAGRAAPARGDVSLARARGIEPVLPCGAGAVVLEGAAIPHALQRRHFVGAGAAARLRGERWIGANGSEHDVRALGMVVGNLEAASG